MQLKPRTNLEMEYVRDLFLKSVGNIDLSLVSIAQVIKFRDYLLEGERKLQPTTIKKKMRLLVSMLNAGITNLGIDIPELRLNKSLYPKQGHAEGYENFTIEELKAFFESPVYTGFDISDIYTSIFTLVL